MERNSIPIGLLCVIIEQFGCIGAQITCIQSIWTQTETIQSVCVLKNMIEQAPFLPFLQGRLSQVVIPVVEKHDLIELKGKKQLSLWPYTFWTRRAMWIARAYTSAY